MGWTAIVDLPLDEARAPLYASLARTGVIMATGLLVAFLAGLFLARRMIVPIRALQHGAAEIGAGDFEKRIDVRTGDELEALADQFNEMAGQLQESHRDLERKIEERTEQLAQSVRELTALGAVATAVNSTLDLDKVLTTIVTKAVELSNTETGSIYVFDAAAQEFRLQATYGASDSFVSDLNDLHIRLGETPVGEAAERGEPVQIADISQMPASRARELLESDGYRAVLAVPLLRAEEVIGALVVRRRSAGEFPSETVRLLQSFAGQSVLAVHNARLFTELQDKSRQLELASEHKSQFLANMSHELRTPLNAIIGYTELIADQTYGTIPERAQAALERVQINGRHLLGLINDVLDLAKIEAGQLTLSIAEYQPQEIVRSVMDSLASLAQSKGLELRRGILANSLQRGIGDERRLTQVLLNLVANAIKFTDQGHVEVSLREIGDSFEFAVQDTGPGISKENQMRIFDEFQQVDDSNTRAKGGTGLGLSITKKIIGLHGGHIAVNSALGQGATFTVSVPIRVEAKQEAV
jgi:signal transduction histidine kinase